MFELDFNENPELTHPRLPSKRIPSLAAHISRFARRCRTRPDTRRH